MEGFCTKSNHLAIPWPFFCTCLVSTELLYNFFVLIELIPYNMMYPKLNLAILNMKITWLIVSQLYLANITIIGVSFQNLEVKSHWQYFLLGYKTTLFFRSFFWSSHWFTLFSTNKLIEKHGEIWNKQHYMVSCTAVCKRSSSVMLTKDAFKNFFSLEVKKFQSDGK